MKITFTAFDDEYWYGGAVEEWKHMPFYKGCDYSVDLTVNQTYNQAAPFFVSSCGRYLFSNSGFSLTMQDGNVTAIGSEEIFFGAAKGGTLQAGYIEAQARFFPPSGKLPDALMFSRPQYSTWIELGYDQRQDKILGYAQTIIDAGMPAGEIIIDDGWQEDYGVWNFNARAFQNPKTMVEKLNDMGFKVILWLVPYISPDSFVFRELERKGLLVRDSNGQTAIRKWWNGYSALLDLTNPKTIEWVAAQTENLKNNFGIDGFKLDGGDAYLYKTDDMTYEKSDPNGQCRRWAELGLAYAFSELRACWGCGGSGIAQRLSDKSHVWNGQTGLSALIPCAVQLGLIGHPFCCPDMIGGGQISDFSDRTAAVDEELCIRWLEASLMMPMMQFSFAIWRNLSEKAHNIVVDFARKRAALGEYFCSLAEKAARSGQPIIQSLEFAYPKHGYEKTVDCFVVGKYLVAPVLVKGARERRVRLPKGRWKNRINNQEVIGGKEATYRVELDELLYFEEINKE